jgi:hypothetical protein
VALRPVSELGLVEVTDVPGSGRSARASSRTPSRPAEPERTPVDADETVAVEDTSGSAAVRLATSVLSGTIGAASAVLVARAILRR